MGTCPRFYKFMKHDCQLSLSALTLRAHPNIAIKRTVQQKSKLAWHSPSVHQSLKCWSTRKRSCQHRHECIHEIHARCGNICAWHKNCICKGTGLRASYNRHRATTAALMHPADAVLMLSQKSRGMLAAGGPEQSKPEALDFLPALAASAASASGSTCM